MHLNYVANGLGGQSMYLLYLASQRKIPREVIAEMKAMKENQGNLFDVADFSCTGGVCGV